jgi:adenine-specific DNA-methyltransferase
MLNTILDNKINGEISEVSGITNDWNKSLYNKKNGALNTFTQLVSDIDSKYLIISYNNEGFISYEEMMETLSKYGNVKYKEIQYNTFRGCKNLKNREKYTTEYLFILKKI